MKKRFTMVGTFCDHCGENITFVNHIGLYKGTFKNPTKQVDLCDELCKSAFLRKHKSWR